MNRETIDGDTRYRQEFKDRAEAGRGYWSKAPTTITPGVSRGHTGAVLRDDLMPGTSSSRGSRTAMFNPMNSMSFNTNTIAPMVNRGKERFGEPAAKRLRLSEPSEPPQNHSKPHNRQVSSPLAGASFLDSRPSTSRGATTKNSYRAHDGDGSSLSDDPIDSFPQNSQRRRDNGAATASHSIVTSRRRSEQEAHPDDAVNPRSRSDGDKLAHRQGTPSGRTVFQSILLKREKFEPDLKPLPPRRGRIANMKGQASLNGRGRSALISGKPRQHGGLPITFTGTEDPLSQPSLSPRRRPNGEMEMILDADDSIPRRSIKGMFFEWKPHDALTGAYLLFDEQGRRLTLQFSGKEMHIFKHDITWMKTDNLTHLFICIETGARIHRELEESHLWMPKTLDEFPSHTISLKFQRHDLEDPDQHINGILDGMSGSRPPPKNFESVSVAWSRLESKRPITIKTFDDGSDLTSPSPERDVPPTRFARNLSTRVPVPAKRPTRASGVKEVDLDNDEVMLVYPFTGTGSTQITRGEHQRLHPGEYLNDTLIEFGLRHWLESLKETNPSLAEQIHVFSPFFYKKLKHKDPQAGYNAVKKWTSKVDIFQKRYLVVPINERLHWYLAIVLYPENVLRSAKSIYQEIEPDTPSHGDLITQDITDVTPMEEVVEETPESSLPSSRAVSPQQMQVDGDTEMKDSLIPETITVPGSSEKAPRTAPSSPGFPEEELLNIPDDEELSPPPDDSWKVSQDTTWVLSFDSLGGNHPSALKALRDYLTLEAKHKKGLELESSVSIVSRKVPSPVQNNYCDCGVYVIKTVETFLKRPDEFFRRLIDKKDKLTSQHPLWNGEEFEAKREELFVEITRLSLEWMKFKATAEAGKAPTRAVSANGSKPPNSPTQRNGGLFTDEESGDEIEIVGEAPAPRGRAARPVPPKLRRARRLS